MNNDWYNEAQPIETRRRFLQKLGQASALTMLGGAPRAMGADGKHGMIVYRLQELTDAGTILLDRSLVIRFPSNIKVK